MVLKRNMVRNNQMRWSDIIHFLNMPDNGLLYDHHDSQTLLHAGNTDVRPRKRLYHKVSPAVVAAINAGLRVKLLKGPMERFMS